MQQQSGQPEPIVGKRAGQLSADLCGQPQALLDALGDGICGLDCEGRVSFANPAAVRLLAVQPEAIVGRFLHDLLHGAAPEDSRCGSDCPLRLAETACIPASGEEKVYRADGSSFPAEYQLTPILDHGRPAGSVLSFRDISQRQAKERQKNEFISTVSHELRTPLTSIRGALGLLSSGVLGPVNAKASKLLHIALNNSDRLVRLINDILDLERIQSGREPLAFRSVQLDEVVRQAIEGMSPVADQAGVHLVHDSNPVLILADPDHLLQVLTNLLSNAVKFSPRGAEVSVTLSSGAEGVTLSVIDSGRGIPANKLETIFGRFQQVEPADAKLKGGSGLGLAISRTIVEQHSGRIWAERNDGPGCTFRVFLPFEPVPASPSSTAASILLADAHGVPRPSLATASRPRPSSSASRA
jgi:PAS domain S-box-containing protein